MSEVGIEEREPDYNVTPRAGYPSSASVPATTRPPVCSRCCDGASCPPGRRAWRSATSRSTPGRSRCRSGRPTSGRSGSAAASSPPTRSTSGRPQMCRRSEVVRRACRTACAAAMVSRSRSRGSGRSGATRAWRTRTSRTRGSARARSSPRAANDLLAPIHERMPVVLAEDAWDTWLDPSVTDVATLERLLAPAPDEWFTAYAVSTRCQQARQQRRRSPGAGVAVECGAWSCLSTSTPSPTSRLRSPTPPNGVTSTRRCRRAPTGRSLARRPHRRGAAVGVHPRGAARLRADLASHVAGRAAGCRVDPLVPRAGAAARGDARGDGPVHPDVDLHRRPDRAVLVPPAGPRGRGAPLGRRAHRRRSCADPRRAGRRRRRRVAGAAPGRRPARPRRQRGDRAPPLHRHRGRVGRDPGGRRPQHEAGAREERRGGAGRGVRSGSVVLGRAELSAFEVFGDAELLAKFQAATGF